MATAQEVEQLWFWQRFPFRVTVLYAVPVYIVLGVIGIRSYNHGVETSIEQLQKRLHAMTTALATSIPPEIGDEAAWTAEDREGVRAMFETVGKDEPDIASIYVVRKTADPTKLAFQADWTRDGDSAELGRLYDVEQAPKMLEAFAAPTVEDELYTDEWGASLSGYAPIRDARGQGVAVVGCDVNADEIEALKWDVLRSTALSFGVAAVSIGIVGLFVARMVRIPLESMVDVMNRIARGELSSRARLDRTDEFGVLARHLNAMATGLQEREHIRAVFGRYVSEGVARTILGTATGERLGGEERDVTIVFSDIRAYSTISEKLTPPQVVRMLNEYMGAMGELVDEHGGVVIEFLGDGLLAAFGAPGALENHPEAAVRCARAMDARLLQLNEEWEKSGLAYLWKDNGIARLEARIGVHTGKVVAGNMGGDKRVKYTVIGDAVNVASRVEHLNNKLETRLLVTEETLNRLPADVREQSVPLGSHEIKGRAAAITVFTFNELPKATIQPGRGTLAET